MTTNRPTHRRLIGRAGKDLSLEVAGTDGRRLRSAAPWLTVPDQTGGKHDGLSICHVLGALPTPRAVRPLDRHAGPRRCSFQHVPYPVARHHLPPVRDPDLRALLYTRYRADRLGVALGDPCRTARYRPLGGQLHPAEPDPRGAGQVNAVKQSRDVPGRGSSMAQGEW